MTEPDGSGPDPSALDRATLDPSALDRAADRAALGRAAFRRATARYATGIAVVTTRLDDFDHAMTANSFTSVSLDPLLALVCVEIDSRFHEAVLLARRWSVSFLPAGSAATARWFAEQGRPLPGQFDRVATRRGANDCLILADALAALELTTEQVVRAGDHDVLIGAVTAIHPPVDDPDEGPRPATVYFASTFHDFPGPTAHRP